ncbi:hypothetical protein FJT64_000199 [Amphibalanus amphitrite]|uniref:Uncharacterized protein n=1 Tax=Amphibalanus amphitrite TaxID=1232801 RepID=A0A6A4XEZ3_AMPAM|nr:hypothetical protein FJT64_000199 [Amphibalanus amphitrite]
MVKSMKEFASRFRRGKTAGKQKTEVNSARSVKSEKLKAIEKTKSKGSVGRSLKRQKREQLRQLLDSFPRELAAGEEAVVTDVARMVQREIERELDQLSADERAAGDDGDRRAGAGGGGSDSEFYSSRLEVRRQVSVATRPEPRTPGSEYDSWAEQEDNFNKIYEPIDFRVRLDSWRDMSREEMLDNVRSQRLRRELRHLSRSEILARIATLHRNPTQLRRRRRSGDERHGQERRQVHVEADVRVVRRGRDLERRAPEGHSDTDFDESEYVSRSDVLRNLKGGRREADGGHSAVKARNGFSGGDGGSGGSRKFVSRLEMTLTPVAGAPPRRPRFDASSASDWDSCSCTSCGCDTCSVSSAATIVRRGHHREYVVNDAASERSECDSWSAAESSKKTSDNVIMEQEHRLKALSRLDDEKKRKLGAEIVEMVQPVSVATLRKQRQVRELRKQLSGYTGDWETLEDIKAGRKEQLVRDLRQKLAETMKQPDSDDRVEKIKSALRSVIEADDVAALPNVNLGLIYVPMEENLKANSGSNKTSSSREQNTDADTFGSLDSLIFEPKPPSTEAILEEEETEKRSEPSVHEDKEGSSCNCSPSTSDGEGGDEDDGESVEENAQLSDVQSSEDESDGSVEVKAGRRSVQLMPERVIKTTQLQVPKKDGFFKRLFRFNRKPKKPDDDFEVPQAIRDFDHILNVAIDSDPDSTLSFESVIFKGPSVENMTANETNRPAPEAPPSPKSATPKLSAEDTVEQVVSANIKMISPVANGVSPDSAVLTDSNDGDQTTANHEELPATEDSSKNANLLPPCSISKGTMPTYVGNLRRQASLAGSLRSSHYSRDTMTRPPSAGPSIYMERVQHPQTEDATRVAQLGDLDSRRSTRRRHEKVAQPDTDTVSHHYAQLSEPAINGDEQRKTTASRTPSRDEIQRGHGQDDDQTTSSDQQTDQERESTSPAAYERVHYDSIDRTAPAAEQAPVSHSTYERVSLPQGGPSSGSPVASPTSPAAPATAELLVYDSRHGEPLYGTRNRGLVQTSAWCGAYVRTSDEEGSDGRPLVFRDGRPVPLTEEMFRQTSDEASDAERASAGAPQVEQGASAEAAVSAQDENAYEDISLGDENEVEDESVPEDAATEEHQGEVGGEGTEAVEQNVTEPAPAEEGVGSSPAMQQKLDRLAKVGAVPIGFKKRDSMLRELKSKLKERFNTSDTEPEPAEGMRDHLVRELSNGGSVALKREQMESQFSRMFQAARAGLIHVPPPPPPPPPPPAVAMPPALAVVEETSADEGDIPVEVPTPDYDTDSYCECEFEESESERGGAPSEHLERAVAAATSPPPVGVRSPETVLSTEQSADRHSHRSFHLHPPLDSLDPPPQGAPLFRAAAAAAAAATAGTTSAYSLSKTSTTFYSERAGQTSELEAPGSWRVEPRSSVASTARLPRYSGPRPFRASSPRTRITSPVGVTNNAGGPRVNCWSDLESIIFAEGSSGESAAAPPRPPLPTSRMDTYQDEWMYWDQKVKLRSSANPEDRERWRDEKTRRMLLWLHHSDSAAAGSAVWWQVGAACCGGRRRRGHGHD